MNTTPQECRLVLCNVAIGFMLVLVWTMWGFGAGFASAILYLLASLRDNILHHG